MPIEWLSLCINITNMIIKYLVAILFEHPLQIHQHPGKSNLLQSVDSYEPKYNGSENLDIYWILLK